MELKIKLEEDAELRQAVKNLAEGQLKAISRDLLKDIMKEEAENAIGNYMRKTLDAAIDKELNGRGYNTLKSIIQETVRVIIEEKLKDKIILPEAIVIKVKTVTEIK